MSKERIQGSDSLMDMFAKMSDGNPGALGCLTELYKQSQLIDHDDILGGIGCILNLDSFGIYGTDIYILHSDICGRDLVKTLAVIRATQLGLFSQATLKDACSRQDRSGKAMVPVDELYDKVRERLPKFDSDRQFDDTIDE